MDLQRKVEGEGASFNIPKSGPNFGSGQITLNHDGVVIGVGICEKGITFSLDGSLFRLQIRIHFLKNFFK